jgi:hypothetical protein
MSVYVSLLENEHTNLPTPAALASAQTLLEECHEKLLRASDMAAALHLPVFSRLQTELVPYAAVAAHRNILDFGELSTVITNGDGAFQFDLLDQLARYERLQNGVTNIVILYFQPSPTSDNSRYSPDETYGPIANSLRGQLLDLRSDQETTLTRLQALIEETFDQFAWMERQEKIQSLTNELMSVSLQYDMLLTSNSVEAIQIQAAQTSVSELTNQISDLRLQVADARAMADAKLKTYLDQKKLRDESHTANLKSAEGVIGIIAGVILDAVAALFFVQSNRARALMTEYLDRLRTDRRFEEGLAIVPKIEDPKVRAEVQSKLALSLTSVVLEHPAPVEEVPKRHETRPEPADKPGQTPPKAS